MCYISSRIEPIVKMGKSDAMQAWGSIAAGRGRREQKADGSRRLAARNVCDRARSTVARHTVRLSGVSADARRSDRSVETVLQDRLRRSGARDVDAAAPPQARTC